MTPSPYPADSSAPGVAVSRRLPGTSLSVANPHPPSCPVLWPKIQSDALIKRKDIGLPLYIIIYHAKIMKDLNFLKIPTKYYFIFIQPHTTCHYMSLQFYIISYIISIYGFFKNTIRTFLMRYRKKLLFKKKKKGAKMNVCSDIFTCILCVVSNHQQLMSRYVSGVFT